MVFTAVLQTIMNSSFFLTSILCWILHIKTRNPIAYFVGIGVIGLYPLRLNVLRISNSEVTL